MKTGSGVPPWHLWGGSQVITATFNGVNDRSSGGQLAKVGYKRPESWHWFFAARLVNGPTGATRSVLTTFNLTIGVGRTQITLPGFVGFSFDWSGAPPIGLTKFATQAAGSDSGGGALTVIDSVPAQDIQLDATVTNFFGPEPALVEVFGMFAPRTHNRPDWYLDNFLGGETGGT